MFLSVLSKTYPCHGGLQIECVSISSNDILQFGVVLLSNGELQDSINQQLKTASNQIANGSVPEWSK